MQTLTSFIPNDCHVKEINNKKGIDWLIVEKVNFIRKG